jgi:hypothetical protein
MKNILSNVSQSEKSRILEMHKTATIKNHLFEQHSTLPDGVYYGDGSGNEYELFYDTDCEKTTGFKVLNAPMSIRGAVTASETNVIGGTPNSEDWGLGGEIVPAV